MRPVWLGDSIAKPKSKPTSIIIIMILVRSQHMGVKLEIAEPQMANFRNAEMMGLRFQHASIVSHINWSYHCCLANTWPCPSISMWGMRYRRLPLFAYPLLDTQLDDANLEVVAPMDLQICKVRCKNCCNGAIWGPFLQLWPFISYNCL